MRPLENGVEGQPGAGRNLRCSFKSCWSCCNNADKTNKTLEGIGGPPLRHVSPGQRHNLRRQTGGSEDKKALLVLLVLLATMSTKPTRLSNRTGYPPPQIAAHNRAVGVPNRGRRAASPHGGRCPACNAWRCPVSRFRRSTPPLLRPQRNDGTRCWWSSTPLCPSPRASLPL